MELKGTAYLAGLATFLTNPLHGVERAVRRAGSGSWAQLNPLHGVERAASSSVNITCTARIHYMELKGTTHVLADAQEHRNPLHGVER